MSLSQIETFVVVAEEGSLARAARRLHVSQPPLTRQMHALEDELGVRLFQRSARGMALLPAGQLFHARAKALLRALNEAVLAVRAADSGANIAF